MEYMENKNLFKSMQYFKLSGILNASAIVRVGFFPIKGYVHALDY